MDFVYIERIADTSSASIWAPIMDASGYLTGAVTAAVAVLLIATASAASAACEVGERDCVLTPGVLEAGKVWRHCVVASTMIQIKRFADPNAAVEAALGACLAEEDALFATIDLEMGSDGKAAQGRAIFRAKLKREIIGHLSR